MALVPVQGLTPGMQWDQSQGIRNMLQLPSEWVLSIKSEEIKEPVIKI